MTSKHPLPLDNPSPSSTSSSTENEDEDVETSEEEEEELTTPPKPSSIKPNPPLPTSLSKSPPTSSDDDSDASDSDSDSDPSPTQTRHPSALAVKSSKPLPDSTKPTTSAAIKTPFKRPLEADDKDKAVDKKKKKKVSDLTVVVVPETENDKKSVDDQKKLFQRLWTDEDEILILKGMANFKRKGMDPSAQVGAFFDSIKNSLRPDVNKSQLHSKMRTLKRKYHNTAKKAKPGQDPHLSKPHDDKVFHLSKKVWGGDHRANGEDTEDTQVKSVATEASGSVNRTKSNQIGLKNKLPVANLPNGSPILGVKPEECKTEHDSKYIYLNQSLAPRNLSMLPPPALVEIFSTRGWDAMGSSAAKGFDKSWKEVMIAETKAYLQRLDLVREQTQAMLDALESSKE